MTRKEALTELLAEVEAGEIDPRSCGFFKALLPWGVIAAVKGRDAYEGSLDAAKALHEAVLPGKFCLAGLHQFGPTWSARLIPGDFIGANDNPARAWLIAILRALISQEERE